MCVCVWGGGGVILKNGMGVAEWKSFVRVSSAFLIICFMCGCIICMYVSLYVCNIMYQK